FPAQLPLVLDLVGTRFDLVQRRKRYFEMRRLDSLQKALGDRGIDRIAPHRLTGWGGVVGMRLVALVERRDIVMQVTDRHPAPAPAAQHEALQHRGSFTHGATAVFRTPGPVIVQLLLVVPELLPCDVAGMRVTQDDRPVLTLDLPRAPFDAWRF